MTNKNGKAVDHVLTKNEKITLASLSMKILVDTTAQAFDRFKRIEGAMKVRKSRYERERDELLGLVDEKFDLKPAEHLVIPGDKRTANVGMAAEEREMGDMKKICAALNRVKPGLAHDLMKFTLADLKKHLSGEQIEKLVKTTRTGGRKVSFEFRDDVR